MAPSPDERSKKSDKPRADFSNVQAGGSSTAPKPAASQPAATPPKTYTVVSGDSLSRIAKRVYGDANRWPAIFEANKDLIKDPDRIFPGQVLKIPSL